MKPARIPILRGQRLALHVGQSESRAESHRGAAIFDCAENGGSVKPAPLLEIIEASYAWNLHEPSPMSLAEVEDIGCDAERGGGIIGVRRSVTDEDSTEDSWTLPLSRKKRDQPIVGPLPERVGVLRSNLVYVEKEGLPSAMLSRLHRLAAFQNPEFYRAQAMRLSTFGKPRVIRCAEEFPRQVALPRGCSEEVASLFKSHNITVEIDDQRFAARAKMLQNILPRSLCECRVGACEIRLARAMPATRESPAALRASRIRRASFALRV